MRKWPFREPRRARDASFCLTGSPICTASWFTARERNRPHDPNAAHWHHVASAFPGNVRTLPRQVEIQRANSDVAAVHSPAGATSAWRPKGASSGALQAFPKPPIQGQMRSRRVDLTSYCVLKCRCFPLANVDGPQQRVGMPKAGQTDLCPASQWSTCSSLLLPAASSKRYEKL